MKKVFLLLIQITLLSSLHAADHPYLTRALSTEDIPPLVLKKAGLESVACQSGDPNYNCLPNEKFPLFAYLNGQSPQKTKYEQITIEGYKPTLYDLFKKNTAGVWEYKAPLSSNTTLSATCWNSPGSTNPVSNLNIDEIGSQCRVQRQIPGSPDTEWVALSDKQLGVGAFSAWHRGVGLPFVPYLFIPGSQYELCEDQTSTSAVPGNAWKPVPIFPFSNYVQSPVSMTRNQFLSTVNGWTIGNATIAVGANASCSELFSLSRITSSNAYVSNEKVMGLSDLRDKRIVFASREVYNPSITPSVLDYYCQQDVLKYCSEVSGADYAVNPERYTMCKDDNQHKYYMALLNTRYEYDPNNHYYYPGRGLTRRLLPYITDYRKDIYLPGAGLDGNGKNAKIASGIGVGTSLAGIAQFSDTEIRSLEDVSTGISQGISRPIVVTLWRELATQKAYGTHDGDNNFALTGASGQNNCKGFTSMGDNSYTSLGMLTTANFRWAAKTYRLDRLVQNLGEDFASCKGTDPDTEQAYYDAQSRGPYRMGHLYCMEVDSPRQIKFPAINVDPFGGRCKTNSDCYGNLECLYNFCRIPVSDLSTEIAGGLTCLSGHGRDTNVTGNGDLRWGLCTCSDPRHCPVGHACSIDGYCIKLYSGAATLADQCDDGDKGCVSGRSCSVVETHAFGSTGDFQGRYCGCGSAQDCQPGQVCAKHGGNARCLPSAYKDTMAWKEEAAGLW